MGTDLLESLGLEQASPVEAALEAFRFLRSWTPEELPEAMRPLTSAEKVEYRRPDNLPENFAYSDELANASNAWAVEAGASPKIAQAYHDRSVGYLAEQAAAQQAALSRSVEATHDELVRNWGRPTATAFARSWRSPTGR